MNASVDKSLFAAATELAVRPRMDTRAAATSPHRGEPGPTPAHTANIMDSSLSGFSFTDLRGRKRRVEELLRRQLSALQRFHQGDDLANLTHGAVSLAGAGFALNPIVQESNVRMSISSTATCVRSMLASPEVANRADYSAIVAELHKRYEQEDLTTRGLEHGNAYTLGQLLPTLKRIASGEPALVSFAVDRLRSAAGEDGVSLRDFPANGYLTYWALVALDTWSAFDEDTVEPSLNWSQSELYRQLALFGADDDEADAYQLGYNLLIQRRFRSGLVKDSIVVAGLTALFDAQRRTGLWEKKEPLFIYEGYGDAYPFTFELLNAVLREFTDDVGFLQPHEEALARAMAWAARNAYGGDTPLWRSGHLAVNTQPESWATAEVYYFLQNYRAYLAERIRAGVMHDTGRGRPARAPDPDSFSSLYQPSITLEAEIEPQLLGDLLADKMLDGLRVLGTARPRFSLAAQPGRDRLPRSGIFFGPPGTGKTTYADKIADYVGWPLITVTPADFAAEGLLLIPTVGRRLFDRLVELEDTVILFDEMEELLRTRADEGGTFEQRFVTTSFLPSLQDLREQATCIYLVATNHLDDFDEAARAPRRFDFQLQVGPPSYEEKRRLLGQEFGRAAVPGVIEELDRAKEKIRWATLHEARDLFGLLADAPDSARDLIDRFTPELADKQDELETEAEQQRF
jgi:ATPase family protein associated with various cellular activities (AAA)